MASLKQIIKENRDMITEGIAWVVIYKEGKSWKAEYYYEESGSYDEGLIFSKDDTAKLHRIAEIDANAICINGYYMGFGENYTLLETEEKVLWMYLSSRNLLKYDFLGGICQQ